MDTRRRERPDAARSWRRIALALLGSAGSACAGGSSAAPESAAPQFEYQGPASWSMTGWLGGPYSNGSAVFVLENHGALPVEWSASSVPGFVELDPLGGTIPPEAQAEVQAALLETVADGFRAGLNTGTLSFHNASAAQPDAEIACSLWIDDPLSTTQLEPATSFVSSGPPTGPFEPPAAVYSLSNRASSTLSWQGVADSPWVSLSPKGGQLAPGDSVELQVAIEPGGTGSLGQGLNESSIEVADSSSGAPLHSRSVFLNLTGSGPDSGWTQFTPSPDTRRVYVSSSGGNDSNDGLSPGLAKRTIAAGRARLRDGFPDWLLLKKGDTWDEVLGPWELSGRSAKERLLVSSYGPGSERPLLRTGSASALVSNHPSNHVAVVGLSFWAHTYAGGAENPRGVIWLNSTSNFLLEDCLIRGYETNVVLQGYPQPGNRHSDVRIRRNVIADAFSASDSNSQGLYASECDGLWIEENVFDHNGWIEGKQGSRATMFRHNVYVQNGCTQVVFRGNVVSGTDGAQIRPGGSISDNLVTQCVCGLQVGVGDTPEPAGIQATISSNVVVRGRGLDAAHPGIFGMRLSNLVGGTIEGNVVARAEGSADSRALWFSTISGYRGPVARGVRVTGNVCHDAGYLTFEGSEAQYDGVLLERNVVQNTTSLGSLVRIASAGTASTARLTGKQNSWWMEGLPAREWVLLDSKPETLGAWLAQIGDGSSSAGLVAFPDPKRDTGTYNASLGGDGTPEAFMVECRKQSRDNWRAQYTAAAVNTYIRNGFPRPNSPGPSGSHQEPR